MEKRKGKKQSNFRFWKVPLTQDVNKYYRDMLCEWQKYSKIKFDGELIEDMEATIEDCGFSRDDMLVMESKSDKGYILNPVEKVKAENRF